MKPLCGSSSDIYSEVSANLSEASDRIFDPHISDPSCLDSFSPTSQEAQLSQDTSKHPYTYNKLQRPAFERIHFVKPTIYPCNNTSDELLVDSKINTESKSKSESTHEQSRTTNYTIQPTFNIHASGSSYDKLQRPLIEKALDFVKIPSDSPNPMNIIPQNELKDHTVCTEISKNSTSHSVSCGPKSCTPYRTQGSTDLSSSHDSLKHPLLESSNRIGETSYSAIPKQSASVSDNSSQKVPEAADLRSENEDRIEACVGDLFDSPNYELLDNINPDQMPPSILEPPNINDQSQYNVSGTSTKISNGAPNTLSVRNREVADELFDSQDYELLDFSPTQSS